MHCPFHFQYAVFMFILFACQLALVIWIFVKRSEFLNTMSDMVQTAFDRNNDADGYPMDALQIAVSIYAFYVLYEKQ